MKDIVHHSKIVASTLHKHVMKHKKYHHYFLLSLVALSAGFFLYNKAVKVHAATYNFEQTEWSTLDASATTSSLTNWNKYSATSTGILVNIDGVHLLPTSYTFTDDLVATTTSLTAITGGGFANGSYSNTTATSSGESVELGYRPFVVTTTTGTVSHDSTNRVYSWTSGSGSITFGTRGYIEYLVLAGGGGSGSIGGDQGTTVRGGGAGGQHLTSTSYAVTATSYNTIVGSGGSGGNPGGNGGSSSFGNITAAGGEGSDGDLTNDVDGFGIAGYKSTYGGGSGSSGTASVSLNGMAGSSSSITGTAVTRGGGGGGGGSVPGNGIDGGSNGSASACTSAEANRGGGAGGPRANSSAGKDGCNGGSGVVIVKYPILSVDYTDSGNFTSTTTNLGPTVSFTTLSVSSTTPAGTSVSVKVRSSPNGSTWRTNESGNGALGDDWTNCSTVTNGASLSTGNCVRNGDQYVQYKATLTTSSPYTSTPTLNNVSIGYTQYPTSGSLTSSKIDTGNAMSQINNISWALSTPAGTNVKFQLRSASTSDLLDSSEWCGPTVCGASADYFETHTGVSGGFGEGYPDNILRNGGDDGWFQYKMFLTSDGSATPIVSSTTVQFVANGAPEFDTSAGAGVTASQISDPLDANWGKTVISYSIKDADGDTGSTMPNYVKPTFEYSLNGGSTWTAITASTLTYLAPEGGELSCYYNSATSTLGSSYTASSNTCAGSVLNLIATTTGGYKTYTVRWDAGSQVEASSANTKIRVTINDQEGANNTANAISPAFNFDSAKPVTTLTFDAGVAGETNSGKIYIYPTDATSSIEYLIYDNYDGTTNSLGSSTGWVSTTTNATTTIDWTFDSDIEVKTLKYVMRDAYGNTTATTTVSTVTPIPEASFIVQDTSNILSDPVTYSLYIGWQVSDSNIFADYELEYATSTSLDGSYSPYVEVAEITTPETEFYVHGNLSTDLYYRYRLGVRDDNGNTTVRSNPVTPSPYVTAKADGVQNYSEGGGGIDSSDPLTITNVSSTNITANEVTITWTTNKYSTSSVEFTSPSSESAPTLIISSTTISNAFALSHSVTLTGLQSNKYYSYQVKSTDVSGNTVTEANGGTGYSFQTRGGPVITNVHTTQAGTTDTTATVFWTTDVPSDSKVYYSTNSSAVNTSTYVYDATATTSHQVELVGLTPGTVYYFKVVSVSSVDNTLISSDSNNGEFYEVNTGSDTTAPTISNIATPVIASDSVVITWTTNEKATSKVEFGTSSTTLDHYTAVDTYPTLNHNVSLKAITNVTEYAALEPDTTYYFRVISRDFSNLQNSTSSEIQSFTTTQDGVVVVTMTAGGGSSNSQVSDTVPPVVISAEVNETSIGAFNADVKITASEEVNAFVSYGETTDYGSVEADIVPTISKTIKLKKLKTGTTYHYRVEVMDKAGNRVPTADATFKTKFVSEVLDNRTTLDKADELQGQIEQLLESALPSLSPPYVSKPEISNITESGATITWNTNIKTIGTLSYSTDEDYKDKETYTIDVPTSLEKLANHSVELVNLKPNSKYHVQAKSYVFPQVMGKSPDITFITKAAKVKADILEKKKDGFTIAWTTDEPTTSIVEYKNVKTGDVNRTTDNTMKTYHAVKIENLPPATPFNVLVSGTNASGNLIEAAESVDVTTSSDTVPPVISNFKVDNALVPGRTDRIQTVVGWQTDEPANAVVYYEEGAGTPGDTKELVNKVESLDSYTANHIMILASLKPGAIYRIKVVSTDEGGNVKVFGPRTIITPRQTESVLDIIFKNFEDTFKFLRQ